MWCHISVNCRQMPIKNSALELIISFCQCKQLITLSLVFWPSSFPQFLRCEANIVASCYTVPYLRRCYVWVFMSNAVHYYWKCYINVVTWMCLGFHQHTHTLHQESCMHISQTPHWCVLQLLICTHVIRPLKNVTT